MYYDPNKLKELDKPATVILIADNKLRKSYKDGIFTLTDEIPYYCVMSIDKNNIAIGEYSGMHHATKESAEIELGYCMGDDWRDNIKSLEVVKVLKTHGGN